MDTNDPFVWDCPVCGTKVLGTSEEAATHLFDCASVSRDEHYGGFVKYGVKQPFAAEFLWLSKGAPADDPPERFSDGGREGEYRES
jgi:hypothetical protein